MGLLAHIVPSSGLLRVNPGFDLGKKNHATFLLRPRADFVKKSEEIVVNMCFCSSFFSVEQFEGNRRSLIALKSTIFAIALSAGVWDLF